MVKQKFMVGVCFMKDVYCDIINLIGLKNFLILCENFGGESIYFPKKIQLSVTDLSDWTIKNVIALSYYPKNTVYPKDK